MSAPDDVDAARRILDRVYGRPESVDGEKRRADEMLDAARSGDLPAYVIVERTPNWLYRAVLLHNDPYADVGQRRVDVRPIPREHWCRNDYRNGWEFVYARLPDDRAREEFERLDTNDSVAYHDNASLFLRACVHVAPLRHGPHLCKSVDPLVHARRIADAITHGVSPEHRWDELHVLGLSESELREFCRRPAERKGGRRPDPETEQLRAAFDRLRARGENVRGHDGAQQVHEEAGVEATPASLQRVARNIQPSGEWRRS